MSKNNTLVLYCVSSVCHSLFNIYIYIYIRESVEDDYKYFFYQWS